MTQILNLESSGLCTIKRKLCENALKTTEFILDNVKNKNAMSLII